MTPVRHNARAAVGKRRKGSGAGRRYMPLGLNLAGWRCLVVGGGRQGTRKTSILLRGGARITVVSPKVSGRLRRLIQQGHITWKEDCYASRHLQGYRFVVAATDDPSLNVRVGRAAQAKKILSCVVSSGRSSQVIFPAVHRRGGLTVAVHSDGRDCTASRRARDRIASLKLRR